MRKSNHPEYQYLNLLKEVLEKGIKNVDRGTGAISYSVFGRQSCDVNIEIPNKKEFTGKE